MAVANCPSCGAPVEFAIGSSAVVICGYCRSVVARTDRDVEAHGKVAALIDTGSPLQVGTTGRISGVGFRITGRSQLQHQAGGVWDEWYAALDDGRWGWLAEAQGRFYVTFQVASDAPPLDQLQLGARVGDLTVAEIGQAKLLSAEGELPWRPEPGYEYPYADLTGPELRFATIDYSEEPPVVFKGKETTLAELRIAGDPARKTRIAATALNCSQCGGALELRAPDEAERIWCPNCGAGHDIAQGKLRFFQLAKKKKVELVIPLGTTGTIEGDPYVVAGFMQRSVHFDMTYYWTEYLLYNRDKGYRWLVCSDDHWSFVTPLRPGEVDDPAGPGVGKTLSHNWQTYKLFQDATATVTYVVGEFYWKVAAGERVDTADYIAPPYGISKEMTTTGARELSYSHARYMQPEEVETAFGVTGLPRPRGIAPMQPFSGPKLGPWYAMMLLLLLVTAAGLAVTLPGRVVSEKTYDLHALPPPQGAPENARVAFSEPFELSGRHNIEVRGTAGLSNSWLFVAGDLVNQADGAMQSFELPLEYYSGSDGGERWSEGKKTRRRFLGRPARGKYVVRLEVQWEAGKLPPLLTLRVREGVFRWPYFLLALFAITIVPMFALIRQVSWESQRWQDSAHSPYLVDTGEDDEE